MMAFSLQIEASVPYNSLVLSSRLRTARDSAMFEVESFPIGVYRLRGPADTLTGAYSTQTVILAEVPGGHVTSRVRDPRDLKINTLAIVGNVDRNSNHLDCDSD